LKGFIEDWSRLQEQGRQPDATAPSSQPSAEVPTTPSRPKNAFEQLVNMPGFEQILLRFLINNQGTVTESTPPRSMADPAVVESIDIEAAKLRKQGKSEKSAYRTLAKQYHSDINDNPEAAEKMRVVSARLESVNREAGRRAKQAEASGAEKVAA
jgi:ribosomal protein S20